VFDPDQQRNQHYVPVFWQRKFAGIDGVLWGLQNGRISPVSANKMMSQDWTYTTFDRQWNASNFLERVAGRRESEAAQTLRNLDSPNYVGGLEEQIELRYFFAFSACRHPDAMGMLHRRAGQLAELIADVHSCSPQEFCKRASGFGLSAEDAALIIAQTGHVAPHVLQAEAAEVLSLSPQDSKLPQQLAIDTETVERTFFQMSRLYVTILDAPSNSNFILGDTPFPAQLISGFTLPISSRLALLWHGCAAEHFPDWTRRGATQGEVEDANRAQIDNALKVVVGPSREALEKYAGTP
jgi:hypothetical protein